MTDQHRHQPQGDSLTGHRHDHIHGTLDSAFLSTQRGIWALKWSLWGLLATALFQLCIVLISNSVALLADTIHNFGDAAIAIPLWIAFIFVHKKSTNRFTYGYGRLEDAAGIVVVLAIFISGVAIGYVSLLRFFTPHHVEHLWAVIVASVVGFLGNEAVAMFRIKVGREIGSAALVAEGYHARMDGLGSLGVLAGALGVWFGFPLADPLIGLLIMLIIFKTGWESGKSLFTRLLDGVDPEIVEEIRQAANHVPGVENIAEVRVRWIGHRLLTEVNIAVASDLTVEQGHDIAKEVRHQLLHHLHHLADATIHVDPFSASGERHHEVSAHDHDELPTHSH
ncbi:MAG TPA: cation diffusion facilitator family transporter [Nitrospira sp.]|nr:cation diffusion facilitator family transporter [Nitrospira sp.]